MEYLIRVLEIVYITMPTKYRHIYYISYNNDLNYTKILMMIQNYIGAVVKLQVVNKTS